jgi:hypothetical protein
VTLLDVLLAAGCVVLAVLWLSAGRDVLRMRRALTDRAAKALLHDLERDRALEAAQAEVETLRAEQASAQDRQERIADRLAAMSEEELDRFVHVICPRCMGFHDDGTGDTCPRVKRLRKGPSGNVTEVEFWPDGQWDRSAIIWPEDIKGLVREKREADVKPTTLKVITG